MKKILLLLFSVCILTAAKAQCSFPILLGTTQITSNTTITSAGAAYYWICSDLTVTINYSEGSLIYLESNVTLNIVSTDGDEIYAKSGCVINLMDGDIDVTYFPNVIINNTGTGTVLPTICNSITYDYSAVGGSACASSSIQENQLTGVSMYPNPFICTIVIAGMKTEGEATLYNILGDEVQSWKITAGDNKIETNTVTAGVYFLKVKTANGVATMKIMKQ